jgi:ankyrin repeat protein
VWAWRQQLIWLENSALRDDSRFTMRSLVVVIVTMMLVTGCKSVSQNTFQKPSITIHEAAEKGNIESIKNHCDAGTDLNEKNKYGDTPLHIAAVRTSKETVELLIKNGADVNSRTKWGRTPLAEAASVGSKTIVELLIAEGADVNAREMGGGTPLHQATYGDHVEVAELLITNGANVNAQDNGGYTPMDYSYGETASLLLIYGGKTKDEL